MNAQISINFSSSLDIEMQWSEKIKFFKIPVLTLTSFNHLMGFSSENQSLNFILSKELRWKEDPVISRMDGPAQIKVRSCKK